MTQPARPKTVPTVQRVPSTILQPARGNYAFVPACQGYCVTSFQWFADPGR